MRFNMESRTSKPVGIDVRVRTRFAWLPVRANFGHGKSCTVWLERYNEVGEGKIPHVITPWLSQWRIAR